MDKICRTLAVAVSTGRMAGIFLENEQVIGWRKSNKGAKSPKDAAAILKSWCKDFDPDLVISEDHATSRKGVHVKAILETIGQVLDKHDGLNIRLSRKQVYQDKYEEAKVLSDRFPCMLKLLPKKPPIWLPEPQNMSYFEALSFVEQLKD